MSSRTFTGSVAVRTKGSPRTQVPSGTTQVQVRPSSEEIAAEFARIVQAARGGPKPTRPPRAGHHWASVNGKWTERRNKGTVPENERRRTPASAFIKHKDGTMTQRKSRKQRK